MSIKIHYNGFRTIKDCSIFPIQNLSNGAHTFEMVDREMKIVYNSSLKNHIFFVNTVNVMNHVNIEDTESDNKYLINSITSFNMFTVFTLFTKYLYADFNKTSIFISLLVITYV